MNNIQGFPIIDVLNKTRTDLYNSYHRPAAQRTQIESAAVWFSHKLVSAICLPTNTAATGCGTLGMTASACTLGAFKVVLYAGSLGNIKPAFSTGVNWLAERTLSSFAHIFINLGELLYDSGELVYEGYRGLKFAAAAIKMDKVFAQVMNVVSRLAERIEKRFENSLTLAAKDERKLGIAKTETLPGLKELDQNVEALSCFKCQDNRTYSDWFQHKALSAINLPAHILLTAAGTAGLSVSLTLCAAKVALCTATRIHVPVPTGIEHIGKTTAASGWIVLRNSAELIADAGVIVYKVSDSLGITSAVVSVAEFVTSIPKLIFS